jgi:tetratricopeptide (TPR) repeat protein
MPSGEGTHESLQVIDELQEMATQRYVPPELFARIYARLGEKEKAFAYLAKVNKSDPPDLSNSAFDSLRADTEAYLAAHNGAAAAVEYQKLIDHPGIVSNYVTGALAHLQLGRAYAMQGDTAKAKAAYQDFLTLWKDADPDIPILIAAKAEYAKL